MDKISCEQVRQELPDYLKEETDSGIRVQIESHLLTCHECTQEKNSIEEVFTLFAKLPIIEPSERFYHNISESFAPAFSAQTTSPTTKIIRLPQRSALFTAWDFLQYQIRERPEWCFTTFAHAAILLILTLIYIGSQPPIPQSEMQYLKSLELPKTSESGNRIIEHSPQTLDEEVIQEALFSSQVVTKNPFLKEFPWILSRLESTRKKELLLSFGGDVSLRNDLVEKGMQYLKRMQQPDGGFSLAGGQEEYRIGITALALLAFLGEGNTHLDGEYKEVVGQGLQFLMRQQRAFGRHKGLIGDTQGNYIYNHSLATYALLENYYLTGEVSPQSENYLNILKSALEYLSKYQLPEGGWGYKSKAVLANLSVSSWPIMVFSLASPLKLTHQKGDQSRIQNFLKQLPLKAEPWKIAYNKEGKFENGLYGSLACGMFCGQKVGAVFSSKILKIQAEKLMAQTTQQQEKTVGENLYFWYYGSLALSQWTKKSGAKWAQWEKAMLHVMAQGQIKEGSDYGAIQLADRYLSQGGTIYSTALALMSLQTSYRY